MLEQLRGAVRSLGLVFGDIGTSPIYALALALTLVAPGEQAVIGLVSLIIWTIMVVVCGGYLWLAMGLASHGEGGTVVMRGIICRGITTGRTAEVVTFVSIVGLALMIGDGVVTPAISLLSSAEGLRYYHHLAGMQQWQVAALAAALATLLFSCQRYGSARLSAIFGPVMFAWFTLLLASGAAAVAAQPRILAALDPREALSFLVTTPRAALPVLGAVVLVTAGSEALYADMGQIGRRAVRLGALLVVPAIVVSYLGQGAFILASGTGANPLFQLLVSQLPGLYPLVVALSIAATAIASQAVISGVFSVVYQAITRRVLPLLTVVHTSRNLHGQVYIPAANRAMYLMVLLLIASFGSSAGLAGAYGMAAGGSMMVTSLLMVPAYICRRKPVRVLAAIGLFGINVLFVAGCVTRLGSGGWLSLAVTAAVLAIVLLWTVGHRRLHERMPATRYADFCERFAAARHRLTLSGTAVFLVKHVDEIPWFVDRCTCQSGIIYERNVLTTIVRTGQPDGIRSSLCATPIEGIERLEIVAGYLERVDVEACFQRHGVCEKVVFYGDVEISSSNPVWKAFTVLKRLTPSFTGFNSFPQCKLQGVMVRVEM